MTALRFESYDIANFTWDAHRRTFSAEASDLQLNQFDRLYDDACDVGLAIGNPDTGRVATFYLAETDTDGEGDIRFWRLLPTAEALRLAPGLRGARVIIFND